MASWTSSPILPSDVTNNCCPKLYGTFSAFAL